MNSTEITPSKTKAGNSKPGMLWPYIGSYYFFVAAWGFASVFPELYLSAYHFPVIACLIFPTLWMIEDRKNRGRFTPHAAQPIFGYFWFVTIPAYVIWTRKLKGLMWVVVHFAATYILTLAMAYLAIYIFWGPEYLQAQ